jgi:uroporphyrinogen-III decarboxylase
MMEMTSRERVMAALRLEETDRVPHCELFVDVAMAEKLLNQQMGQAATGGSVRSNPYTVDQAKAVAAKLGHDNIGFILRAQDYAKMAVGKDGRTFPADGMIKTEADLDMIDLPDPTRDEFYKDAEEFVKNKGDYACHLSTRIGLTQVMLSLGMEDFALMLYDNRKLVEQMLDIYFDWTAEMAQRISQLGFDIFWTTDDFAFKTGLFFSPADFRDLLFERYQRVLDRIDIPWVLHSDGNINEALPILVELGVVGTHPNEKGAMDMVKVKQEFGDKMCLLGNVDLVLLGRGTPDEVDAEVKELIRTVGPGGGYIITSGNSLASFLKPENVLAMAAAARKYGAYPLNLKD